MHARTSSPLILRACGCDVRMIFFAVRCIPSSKEKKKKLNTAPQAGGDQREKRVDRGLKAIVRHCSEVGGRMEVGDRSFLQAEGSKLKDGCSARSR